MSNLTKRILSAVVLAPLLLLLVFFASKMVFVYVVSIVSGLAGFEFGNITLSKLSKKFSVVVGMMAASITYTISLFLIWPHFLLLVVTLSLISLFVTFMFSKTSVDEAVPLFTFAVAGTFYCGILIGFIGLIFVAKESAGPFWILLLILGTFLGDTGAYTFGRLFGNRKLAPRLSPGKTWAGAFGGLFTTTASVVALRFFYFHEMSWIIVFSLSICLSVSCQLGDLAESFLKRGIGVKDSGHMIPGHGGILDRIDALMFGAPVVFLFSMLQ